MKCISPYNQLLTCHNRLWGVSHSLIDYDCCIFGYGVYHIKYLLKFFWIIEYRYIVIDYKPNIHHFHYFILNKNLWQLNYIKDEGDYLKNKLYTEYLTNNYLSAFSLI